MLQKPVDGFSASASRKRPARAVFGFALAAMFASLVATDYPVIVSPAYAGGDFINDGVAETRPKFSIIGPKFVITGCKPGYVIEPGNEFGSGKSCKKRFEVDTRSTKPSFERWTRYGPGEFPAEGSFTNNQVLGIGAAAAAFGALISSGNDTPGTTPGTTAGTR
jgi:hypothetical protein